MREKRRLRKLSAALLALMLAGTAVAVSTVAIGSPVQAANTSSEALVDTDSDGVGDAREFGGRDRYDTANRLAANFGERGGLGSVPVAFVASGLKLVDAISVAGLAGFLDAPVLLTPSDSLDGGAADFIEDYGVQTIHVLGGSAAVSDSVLEAIEGLANKPTVERVAGTDRYATAASVASRLGGGAAWCGGAEAAAILANGGDVSLAYAMAISPVANRLQLPLLLTAADELPSATEDFITDQDIEHVVIIGGESSVSDGVSAALTSAGVNTVTRIGGDTPASASAELAKLTTNGCKADLGLVEDDTVALVAESGLPDGVAASSVLASSYRNGSLVPMLVVGDALSAAVRDYLAATPALSGASKVHLQIVAVGGTAAVSDEVMQAALAAAASADALTAQITSSTLATGSSTEYKPPQAGDTSVVLRFSDNIVADDSDNNVLHLTDLIRDNLEINGVTALLAAADPIVHGAGSNEACDPDTATVTLGTALKAGDVISLAGGAKFGANMDSRTVAGVSVTVPAAAREFDPPPVVYGVGVAGATAGVRVYFNETDLDPDDGHRDSNVGVDDITVTSATGTNKALFGINYVLELVSPATFEVGDRIAVRSGALVDLAGNKSRARTFFVRPAQPSPRITAVTVSERTHSAQASAAIPEAITETSPDSDAANDITIRAKKGSAADGAAGNGWIIAFDRASSWKVDPNAEVDIGVGVNSRHRLVSVRFNSGNAKLADLKSALEANSDFDAMFEVNLPADATGACGATADISLQTGAAAFARGLRVVTAGGKTAVAVEVRFNTYVATIAAADGLADDVFAEAVKRYNAAADPDLATTGSAAAINRLDRTRLVNRLGGTALGTVFGPTVVARYEFETDNMLLLPQRRDLVTAEAGYDTSVEGADQTITPAVAVATSYAADDPTTTKIQEDKNARSQVRIGQSTRVEVPDFE